MTDLRSYWAARQGLDGSLEGAAPAAVLERSGWARSVGGVNPYLTLFARARTSRAAADQAVAELKLHELPSARGCTYVVPERDFALALAAGAGTAEAETKLALKLGMKEKELDRLEASVLEAVAPRPLEPDEIRKAVGGAARSLGEEGKKKGLTSTLPVALGRLQEKGVIRRVPVTGRLDQQRFRYGKWGLAPAGTFTDLARLYWGWIGPATVAEFRWFSALGVKAAAEAIAPLGLVSVPGEGERLMLKQDVAAFEKHTSPKSPRYALVSSLDPLFHQRRDVRGLTDEADFAKIPTEGGRAGATLLDLPSHAIIDRGRLIGLWEFDPEAEKIVVMLFGDNNKGKPDKALAAVIEETEAFVKGDLGDAKSFSLDSPKSRAPRIAALKK